MNSVKMPNEADALYIEIFARLQARKIGGLASLAERLLEIDPDHARSRITQGIVQLYTGQYAAAIVSLEKCIQDFGESGAALTNLAKAYASQGNQALAFRMLRRSLHVDPNQHAALMWYAKLHEGKSGNKGVIEAFEEIAREANSWRSLLWIARERLKERKHEDALVLYRRALLLGYDSEALLMICGDLGAHGFAEDGVALVGPLYDPQVHDQLIGFNLLESFLEVGRYAEGKSLLRRLPSGTNAHMQGQINRYEQRFAEAMRK